MKLIIGLGNPGERYESTRHNVGFFFIDKLLEFFKYISKDNKFNGEVYTSLIDSTKVLFLKPTTFMNLSGECVEKAVNFFKIDIADILVIYDDKDFPVGTLKWRSQGSSGGHNGLKNIITHLRTLEINRLRVGIGSPPNKKFLLADWVLSKFTKDEIEILNSSFDKSLKAIEKFINGESFSKVMNENN